MLALRRPRRHRVLALVLALLAVPALASGCGRAASSSAPAGPVTTTEPLPSPYDIGCTDFLAAPEATRRGAVPSMSATIDVPPSSELPTLVEAGCAARPDRSVGVIIHDQACGVVTPDESPAGTVTPMRSLTRRAPHWRAGGGSGGARSSGRNNGGGSGSSRSDSGGAGSGGPSVTRRDDGGDTTPTTRETHVYRGCERSSP